jgi:hypothetical protein
MVWLDGTVVADADVITRDAIARTDGQGYFQIETARNADLDVRTRDGRTCQVPLNARETSVPYVPLGTVVCRSHVPLGPPLHIAANEGRP